ncbi:STAS domain-containing protein [candidate division WOR-3 bacterium]|nr:STAS domain-containing protein [candidate division WOR-3 bacterium]
MATSEKTMEVGKERIDRLIDTMASLTTGEYDVTLDVDEKNEDEFTQVEFSMNFLIEQLIYERSENENKQQELQEKISLIEQQKQAIQELSTPIIKIWDQVLVLPLIGTLDTRRSQGLTENLLTDIATSQSKIAILDITGVPAVDSAVANHLLKTVASVKLLGAECVITGIRPEVAQTIVHLGVDLTEVETLSNLAEGLKWAFDRLRIRMTQ